MSIVLHPKQSEIVKDRHRFRVVCAGRRGGKTELAVNEMAGKAYAKKGRNIAYIAPTLQQARDIAWVQLVNVCAPITVKKLESPTHTLTVQTVDKGKSTISLRGWESVETMRGQAFDFLVIDEIASMRNWESNWNEILRPTLTDREGECLFISTPKGFNHFYDLYNMPNDKVKGMDYASFHFTSYDNPYLKKEELDKAKQELTEDQFAQEYLADFRKQEGLVYKEFDRKIHLIEELPIKALNSPESHIAGIDFGFTNPTAVVQIKYSDGVFYVYSEWYKTQRTEEQIAEYVKSCNFNAVYPDPEAPSAIEVMNKKGIPVVEVLKNKDSIKNGINAVRQALKNNRLRIHSSCINLISEFETYAYPNPKPDRNENENPIKDHDHALDALRYVINSFEDTSGARRKMRDRFTRVARVQYMNSAK
jgi:PBSX family phage terminase large subunit